MTQDEIIEMAIQGHASTRDAIRWAMNQEREACAKVCDQKAEEWANEGEQPDYGYGAAIRARGESK
jgi:hypothetical protein